MTIETELEVFLSAFFSGIFLYSSYGAIRMVRERWNHSQMIINLEDIIYWVIGFGYLFVQIYHTNNGIIRGYYALGVVFGAVFTWKIFRILSKKWKKIVRKREEKKVDNSTQNR